MSEPLTEAEMLARAARALGKIDLWGVRGATMISLEELEAMACTLAALGVVPIYADRPAPKTLFNPVKWSL